MTRTNVAIVGLGMAVTPHAKSYVDLADRVTVRYAFSPSAARRQAFGLAAMRDRVTSLGGRLRVRSRPATPGRPGHGTRIEVELPLAEASP